MKALSLYQPWASLMAWGEKRIETRSWETLYRGDLLICATAETAPQPWEALESCEIHCALKRQGIVPSEARRQLPSGVALAIVRLTACERIEGEAFTVDGEEPVRICVPLSRNRHHSLNLREWEFGHYGEGRFLWITDNVRPLPLPIPVRGRQRLWTPPADTIVEAYSQTSGNSFLQGDDQ